MKHTTKIATASHPSCLRPGLISDGSTIMGWYLPSQSIAMPQPAHAHHFENQARGNRASAMIREAERWCCGKKEYKIWPPSSCPMGSKLSAVVNIPTQAARA